MSRLSSLLLSYLFNLQTNLRFVDNDDYPQVIRANMPPELILSVVLTVTRIMFSDNTGTGTTTTYIYERKQYHIYASEQHMCLLRQMLTDQRNS